MQHFYAISLLAAATQAISMEAMSGTAIEAAQEANADRTGALIENPASLDKYTRTNQTKENVYLDPLAVPGSDEETRPICTVAGVLDVVDNEGPSAPCCRVYEQAEFKGRYYDFCHYGGDTDITDRYYQGDDYGWHNEVNSFQCGTDVGIVTCAHENDTRGETTDMDRTGECKSGNNNVVESFDSEANMDNMKAASQSNKADSFWIVKDNCAAAVSVVYAGPDCTGHSMFASPSAYSLSLGHDLTKYDLNKDMEKAKGSWTLYGQTFVFNQERSARSVYLAPHQEFEIFEGTQFQNAHTYAEIEGFVGTSDQAPDLWEFKGEDSYTIRSFGHGATTLCPETNRQCYNFPARYWAEDAQPTQEGDWAGNWGNDHTIMHVPGFKLREQWMPTKV